jgi:hypothetical protein
VSVVLAYQSFNNIGTAFIVRITSMCFRVNNLRVLLVDLISIRHNDCFENDSRRNWQGSDQVSVMLIS